MIAVNIDGRASDEYIEDAEGSVRLTLDDPYERAYMDAEDQGVDDPEAYVEENVDKDAPEAWCNAAGVIVDDDSVQVWISTGDPRGAFTMTIRRHPNGALYMSLPYPGEGLPHEETVRINDGLLAIKRTMPEGDGEK